MSTWEKDVDRREVPNATLAALGYEVVCLLEDLSRSGGRTGQVHMLATRGLPETRFSVELLDAPH
jgi:hypothetical protein